MTEVAFRTKDGKLVKFNTGRTKRSKRESREGKTEDGKKLTLQDALKGIRPIASKLGVRHWAITGGLKRRGFTHHDVDLTVRMKGKPTQKIKRFAALVQKRLGLGVDVFVAPRLLIVQARKGRNPRVTEDY